jgi:hypothetical protein
VTCRIRPDPLASYSTPEQPPHLLTPWRQTEQLTRPCSNQRSLRIGTERFRTTEAILTAASGSRIQVPMGGLMLLPFHT